MLEYNPGSGDIAGMGPLSSAQKTFVRSMTARIGRVAAALLLASGALLTAPAFAQSVVGFDSSNNIKIKSGGHFIFPQFVGGTCGGALISSHGAGTHTFAWDGSNQDISILAVGSDCVSLRSLVDRFRSSVWPGSLTLDGTSGDSLTVSWSPPPDTYAASGYDVQYRKTPATADDCFAPTTETCASGVAFAYDSASAGSGVEITGLDSGTGYQIRVRAKDSLALGSKETSRWSELLSANTPAVVTIAPVFTSVTEGEAAAFTLTRTGSTTAALTVNVSVSETGDVVSAADEGDTTFEFGVGASTPTLSVATVADAVEEADSVVRATVTADPAYQIGTPASATVTVTDDDDRTAPRITSIRRQSPAISTNADSLIWRVAFSEAVENVTKDDFSADGTTATVTGVAAVSGQTGTYDVTASGGDLAGLDGTVTLSFASGQDIADAAEHALANTAPTGTNDSTYVLDNTAPTVAISGVPETASAPFTAIFIFSEAVTGFEAAEVAVGNGAVSGFAALSGSAYTALITPSSGGAVTVHVAANVATDAAGNGNTAATRVTSTDVPEISIAAAFSSVTEGEAAVFTLTRTGPTTAALTVNVSVAETGDVVSGTAPTRVTFGAGSATATLSVATVADAVDEADSVVTATVTADRAYQVGTPASVTVADDDAPTIVLEISIAAASASVTEGEAAVFTLTRTGPTTAALTVNVSVAETGDVVSGTAPTRVTFGAGSATATLSVATVADAVDEADSVVTVTVAADGRSPVTYVPGEPATARIAITDNDEDHRAIRNRVAGEWLPRFVRTVTGIVSETLGDRLVRRGPRRNRMVIGGRQVTRASADAASAANDNVGFGGMDAPLGHGVGERPAELSLEDLLRGSSFAFFQGDGSVDHGWALWGEAAGAGFAGAAGDLSLDGTVVSGAAGLEYAGESWRGGVAVFHSQGDGRYEMAAFRSDEIDAWLTSVHPYVRFSPDDAMMVWGTTGYGLGQMTLSDPTGAYETDIAMATYAFGASRRVWSARGFDMALTADGVWTRITSEGTADLSGITGDVYRLRAGLDGGYDHVFSHGARIRPALEIGVRYDDGDAERGAGLEAGGAISYVYPARGLTIEAGGQILLLRADAAYGEWGVSGLIRVGPGSDGRGLSFALEPSYGAAAQGSDRLGQEGAFPALTDEREQQGRVALRFGYGMRVFDEAGLLTPRGSMTFNDDGSQHYGAGFDLTIGPNFILGLQSTHRFDNDNEHGVQLTSRVRW